jgi:VWFA-related protein
MKLGLRAACVLLCFYFLAGILVAQTGASQEAVKAPVATPTTPATSAPAASVRPRFVPVLISVTDSSGTPITGLSKEQLTLSDTNQLVQPLQLYKDFPLHLGVILLSAPASFSQQQAAAIDLIQKVIRPGVDQAFVVTARGKKAWPSDRLEWKQDPAELVKMVQGLDSNAGLPDAFNFDLKTDAAGGDRYTLQQYGNTGVTVFDAAYAMMSTDPRPARRVLVLVRDPWSHFPGYGSRANTTVDSQLAHVIGAAQEMHIACFVIGLEDPRFNVITDNTIGKTYLPTHPGETGGAAYDEALQREQRRGYEAGRANVQRIASETGGATFWSTKKNYADAVRDIANYLAGQYVVTFVPADVPGPVHSLKVSSGSAHVLAQSTFFAPPVK